MSLLITVGSTHFRALTDAALSPSFLAAARKQGITTLVVQLGSAPVPIDIPPDSEATLDGVRVRVLRYTREGEMESLISEADAVISHAGSGTILEVLRRPRAPRLLVVPNPALMDNHQAELAEALQADGYLAVGSVDTLASDAQRLLDPHAPKPTPFPAFQAARFAAILDEVVGFAERE